MMCTKVQGQIRHCISCTCTPRSGTARHLKTICWHTPRILRTCRPAERFLPLLSASPIALHRPSRAGADARALHTGKRRSKRQRRPPAWLQDAQDYSTASKSAPGAAEGTAAAAATEQVGPTNAAAGLCNNSAPQSLQVPGATTQQQMREQRMDEDLQEVHPQEPALQPALVPEQLADQARLQTLLLVPQSETPAGAAGHQTLKVQLLQSHQVQQLLKQQQAAAMRQHITVPTSSIEEQQWRQQRQRPEPGGQKAVGLLLQSRQPTASSEARACATAPPDTVARDAAGVLAAATGQQGWQEQNQQSRQPRQRVMSAGGGASSFPAPSWLKLLSCEMYDGGQALAVRLELAGIEYSGRLTPSTAQHPKQLLQDKRSAKQEVRRSLMSAAAESHQHKQDALDALYKTLVPQVSAAAAAAAGATPQEPASSNAQFLHSPEHAAALGPEMTAAGRQASPGSAEVLLNTFAGSIQQQQQQRTQHGAGPAEALMGRTAEAVRQEHLQQQEQGTPVRTMGCEVMSAPEGLQQHIQQREQHLVVPSPSASRKMRGYTKLQSTTGRDTIGLLSAFALQQELQEQDQQQQVVGRELHPEVLIARTKARKRPTAQP